MKCTNCGAPIEKEFNMCPYCGMSMKDMIDAEDVYEKIDDMDDKLDTIQSRLSTPNTGNPSYTPHPPSKSEEAVGKVATAIFFVVFFIVVIIILGNALTMCATMPTFY